MNFLTVIKEHTSVVLAHSPLNAQALRRKSVRFATIGVLIIIQEQPQGAYKIAGLALKQSMQELENSALNSETLTTQSHRSNAPVDTMMQELIVNDWTARKTN